MGIHTVPKQHRRGDTLALMRQLSARPEGFGSVELSKLLGKDVSEVSPLIAAAARRGHIFRANRRGITLRWFATLDAAKAWVALGPVQKPALVSARDEHPGITISSKPKGKAAPAIVGEAITPGNVRHTYAPAPPGRYEAPADYRGPFALAGVGRCAITGRPWGEVAGVPVAAGVGA